MENLLDGERGPDRKGLPSGPADAREKVLQGKKLFKKYSYHIPWGFAISGPLLDNDGHARNLEPAVISGTSCLVSRNELDQRWGRLTSDKLIFNINMVAKYPLQIYRPV